MVSRYVLLATALYQIATGNDRYAKKGFMEPVVTERAQYKYDQRSTVDTVFRNMDRNAYTLYPYEPSWIYTLCNLVGISGLLASGRLLGKSHSETLKQRFETGLIKECSNANGTVFPIRRNNRFHNP